LFYGGFGVFFTIFIFKLQGTHRLPVYKLPVDPRTAALDRTVMAGARVVLTLSEPDEVDPFLAEASQAQREGFFVCCLVG
jgi:hypothetical protein